MKRISVLVSAAMFLWVGVGLAAPQEGQDTSGTMPPSKVLVVSREFLKPGRGGQPHEKTESAFVQAMARAKWPTHYVAANALTGKARTLFFTGYESFDAWEKDTVATQKNAALSAALDRASISDGDLLSETDGSVLVYNEEQSLRAQIDPAHLHYVEISLFRVRPGHRKEWSDAVKLVKEAYDKIPDAHWITYEAMYGQEDAAYVVFVPLKSAAEIDQAMERDKQFLSAMGEEGMKKLGELEAAAVEFTQTNLFQFSPKMSYPPDAWVKADPEFWKPKAAPIGAGEKTQAKNEGKASMKQ